MSAFLSRDSVHRAIRTFVISFLALFVPGLLGWLNELTEWAASNGQKPFPDGTNLSFLFVSALVSAVITLLNLVWNLVEDASGKGFLRAVPSNNNPPVEGGSIYLSTWVYFLVGLAFLLLIVWIVTNH